MDKRGLFGGTRRSITTNGEVSRVSSGSKGEGPAVEKAAEKGAGATRKEGVKLAADRDYIVADPVDKI